MPRLLHRKRRGAAATGAVAMPVAPLAAVAPLGGALRVEPAPRDAANTKALTKVVGSGGGVAPSEAAAGRGGAGAASAAGEVLAAVWDLPPLGGHDGAAAELREELCRLAAVAIEQRRREEELDLRMKEIEQREAAHKTSLQQQQQQNKKENNTPNKNQLQEQLKVALVKIDKLTQDLNKLTELEDDFKSQITHLETLAKTREESEKEHRSKLESIESERKKWQEKESEFLDMIERLHIDLENANKAAEESTRIEISILQNECNSQQEVITQLESKVEQLEIAKETLGETVRNLQDKITALEYQSEELRAHIEQLESLAKDKTTDEVQVLTIKVEALEERDRQSEGVILGLRQAVCQLEAADSENHSVNASLGARVQVAEMEAMGAAALRDRLLELLDGETIPQEALQSDEDILSTVTNLFAKFKLEEDHCHQRIEQLEARVNELESGKPNELYYQSQHMVQVHDSGATEMFESLQDKLAQSQAAEQDARAMLDELQAKVRYLESTDRERQDILIPGKFRFPAENPEHQVSEPYQIDQSVEHPMFQPPDHLLNQHPFLPIHPSQLAFPIPYPPDLRFQFHPSKDMPQLQPIPTLQPLQPIPVPMAIPPPLMSKATKKKLRQCFKCQKFGHLAKQCTGETTCVVCGVRGHTHNECNTTEARCANCHGPHRASSKTCPLRIN